MLNTFAQSQASKGKADLTAGATKIAAKKQAKYAAVFVLLLAAPATLGFFDFDVHMYFFYGIQVYALLMGIIHLWQMGKRFGWRNQYSFYQKLNITVIIVICGMIMQCIIVYFCKPLSGLHLIFPFSLFPFVFPLMTVSVYEYAISIPRPIYKTWRYPQNMAIPDMDMIDFSNNYILSFLLRKNPSEVNSTVLRFKAPPDRLTFGDLFYLYVYEYNEKDRENPVRYAHPDSLKPYEWLFHIKPQRWWQSRKYIDPSLTIRENKIGENFVIVCERVS